MSKFFRLDNTLYNIKYIKQIYINKPTIFNKTYSIVIEKNNSDLYGNLFFFTYDKDKDYYDYPTMREAYDKLQEIQNILFKM